MTFKGHFIKSNPIITKIKTIFIKMDTIICDCSENSCNHTE